MKIKQVNIGLWWGAFKLIFQNVTSYLQYMILLFTGITAYATLSIWLKEYFGFDLYLWQFALVIFVFLGVLVLFEYSMSMPSFFKMWNSQWWIHGNPMKKEMEEMRAQLDRLEKKLDKKEIDG